MMGAVEQMGEDDQQIHRLFPITSTEKVLVKIGTSESKFTASP